MKETEEAAPCYIVLSCRESGFDFSFKKNPDDELVIYTVGRGHILPIGEEPGRYVCVWRSRINKKRRGFFTLDIKLDAFIEVVIPPYGK